MAAKPSTNRRRKIATVRSKPTEAKPLAGTAPPLGDAPSIDLLPSAAAIEAPVAVALEAPVKAAAETAVVAALEVREETKADAPLIAESISEALRPYLKNFSDVLQVVMRVVEVSSDSYSGQAPHPGHLERLEAVSPGSAKAIIDMAVREQRSRHRIGLLSNLYPYIDQLLGFALAALCFTYGFLLGMAGHDEAGGAMIAISALGAIGWFIMTRLASRKGGSGSSAGMAAQSGAD